MSDLTRTQFPDLTDSTAPLTPRATESAKPDVHSLTSAAHPRGGDQQPPLFEPSHGDLQLEELIERAIHWFCTAEVFADRMRAFHVFLALREQRRPEFIAALEAARLARCSR